jgi:hypothetical protein
VRNAVTDFLKNLTLPYQKIRQFSKKARRALQNLQPPAITIFSAPSLLWLLWPWGAQQPAATATATACHSMSPHNPTQAVPLPSATNTLAPSTRLAEAYGAPMPPLPPSPRTPNLQAGLLSAHVPMGLARDFTQPEFFTSL